MPFARNRRRNYLDEEDGYERITDIPSVLDRLGSSASKATESPKEPPPSPPTPDGSKEGVVRKACRVCSDFKSWFNHSSNRMHDKQQDSTQASATGTPQQGQQNFSFWKTISAASYGHPHQTSMKGDQETQHIHVDVIEEGGCPPGYRDCPLDINELGKATWSFLHTMAAYYPDTPTSQQQKDMCSFIRTFGQFYPCHICANHFRKMCETHPPVVTSRTNLSQWFCERHNDVNKRLGKPQFDCKLVDERWLDGWSDGSCD